MNTAKSSNDGRPILEHTEPHRNHPEPRKLHQISRTIPEPTPEPTFPQESTEPALEAAPKQRNFIWAETRKLTLLVNETKTNENNANLMALGHRFSCCSGSHWGHCCQCCSQCGLSGFSSWCGCKSWWRGRCYCRSGGGRSGDWALITDITNSIIATAKSLAMSGTYVDQNSALKEIVRELIVLDHKHRSKSIMNTESNRFFQWNAPIEQVAIAITTSLPGPCWDKICRATCELRITSPMEEKSPT